ncbi:recombinase family protein [Streptacidiphilus sp. EB129]|uniref:recombinase family protein n=1 Tax=Streptacidiphilus sp. EB129 TaxID=3156262 RepID=UPI00351246FA
MPASEPVPAIGYIRVSTYREEKISPEIQRSSIEEWARRRNRRIVRWVVDLDATGRNFRRKIMEAISGIEAGEAEEIACWKYSRFGRNRHGVALNLGRVEQAGGALQSSTEDADATTATGRFTRGMLFELAAFESDRIGESWRETHDYRRNVLRLPAAGGNRFGYLWTPRLDPNGEVQAERYDPDPETREVLEQLYRKHIAGDGMYVLATWLNDELGLPNTRGQRWSRNGLTRYLDSGFGAGLLLSHRRDVRCGDPGGCQKWWTHYSYLQGAHDAVISDSTWQAYRERRQLMRDTPPRSRNAGYALSGLVHCGRCDGKAVIHGASREKRGDGYRCSGHSTRRTQCEGIWMKRALVEARVRDWIEEIAQEIDEITQGREIKPQPSRPDAGEKQRTKLVAEITRLASGLESAAEKYVLGDIPKEDYVATRDRLQGRRVKAEGDLLALSVEREAARGPEAFRDVIGALDEEWDVMQVSRKRDLLAAVIRSVTLRPGPEGSVVVLPVWHRGL